MSKLALAASRFGRYFPVINWGRHYDRAWLRDDLVSGVVVGLIMIPVAMAYAQMAGVPAQAGLYSAVVGMTAYALLATSRHLKITASSTMAIMSLSVVAPLAGGDAAAFMALSSALALTVGIVMLVLGVLKLGFISDFLTKSVMTGYIFGVACLIAISQLPKVFGVPGGSGTFFQQLFHFVSELPQTNFYSLALGLGAIVMILIIHQRRPLIPGALLALVLGIAISAIFQLSEKHGVSVVGQIPTGMTSPEIPWISLGDLPFIIGGAAGIVFLAVGETLGTGRAYAAKYQYEIDADQELLALGAANVSSGLFQGITIDMSLSSTASGEAAGERTQLSTLVSAGVILAVVVLLAPLLRNLPTTVLGAIVLSSILGLFNFDEFKRYYQQRKADFALALTALIGVVSSSVMIGLAIAVMLSLIMLLYRASRPYIATLGRQPGTAGGYGDVLRHPNAQPIPDLTLLRLDAPLYFFNANVARTEILAHAAEDPPPQAILLDLAATADLDIGTSDMLRALDDDLRQAKIDLLFAQVRGSVRQRMQITGLLDQISEADIFLSVDDAVQAFLARQAAPPPVVIDSHKQQDLS
ncbi:SulP family inorganic anion transporter [Caldilinea sp.]|uniref:SulP family inorganic anion transporter n=1 Tax=Caldilinea sp. TaxID=2293560 RepID=UPI002CC8E575|nr:SulP family inorganic anion transporter [Caldilinea sp.]